MMRAIQMPPATVIWGCQHSQGINWCDTEADARREVESALKYETRQQSQARGKVRLLRRELGPIVEVENPYIDAPAATH